MRIRILPSSFGLWLLLSVAACGQSPAAPGQSGTQGPATEVNGDLSGIDVDAARLSE